MAGIRGVRRCDCNLNMVWGLAAYVPGNWNSQDYYARTGPAKVHVKVSPYGGEYDGVGFGQRPSQWYSGDVGQFPVKVSLSGPNSANGWSLKRPCLCSRAVYIDNQQAAVNYLFASDRHDVSLDLLPAMWCQHVIDEDSGLGGNYNIGLYDAGEDREREPGGSWHDESGSAGLAELFPAIESYWYKVPRPRAFSLGARYLIFCGYPTSDYAGTGGNEWVCSRFDNLNASFSDPQASWYKPSKPAAGGFEEVRYYIMRPSFRTFIDSAAEQPDEAWVCAYDYTTERFVTGRWLDENGMSLANRIEHVLVENSSSEGMGTYPNLVFYQRQQNRDIAIFRGSYDDFAGRRSNETWLYDGSTLTKLNEAPTFATLDPEGNLIYGNSDFVRKTGTHGWRIDATGTTMTAFPVPKSQTYWEKEGVVPPVGWEAPASLYPATFREYSEAFQVIANSGWIQLRGFSSDATLASAPLNTAASYEYATTDNSRTNQCGGHERAPIPCWSISHDGQVRVPHTQPMTAYKGIKPEYHNASGDTRRRIIARSYVTQDCSQWEVGNGADPVSSAWPKWEDPFFSTLAIEPLYEYLPQYEYQDSGDGYQGTLRDAFICATNYFDFDIIGECDCGCAMHAVAY